MAWSFSQLTAFETCPRQFYELKIAQNYQQVLHPTTVWGTRGHLALEERVRDGTALPSEFAYLESFARGIIAIPGQTYCEREVACTSEYQPIGFHDPAAWCRGIVDVLKVDGDKAIVLDYKFGKVKPSAQLKLMALLVFVNFPEVQSVQSRFLWIQFRDKTSGALQRSDADRVWLEFVDRAAALQEAHTEGFWVEKPSGLCKAHCPVKDCDFYQKGARRW